jgi:hypothetical protein
MFCPYCGKEIGDARDVCPYCGSPLKPYTKSGKDKKGETTIVKTIPGSTTVTTESHTFKVDHAELGNVLAACGIDKDADITKLSGDEIQRLVQYVQENYKDSGEAADTEGNQEKPNPSGGSSNPGRNTEYRSSSASQERLNSAPQETLTRPTKLVGLIAVGALLITIIFFIIAFSRPQNKETSNELPSYTQTQPSSQNPLQPNVSTTSPGTSEGKTMQVIVSYLRLYTKPGNNSTEVTNEPTLFPQDTVQVLQELGEWAMVKTNKGNIGWVMLQRDGQPTLQPVTEPINTAKTPLKK